MHYNTKNSLRKIRQNRQFTPIRKVRFYIFFYSQKYVKIKKLTNRHFWKIDYKNRGLYRIYFL